MHALSMPLLVEAVTTLVDVVAMFWARDTS